LALKKLKGSDLSLFKSYFKNHPNVKQKAFNLDKRILEHFFPDIISFLEPRAKKATFVDLVFYGPGLSKGDSLARKVKIDGKNLRLNGELVHNPEDEPKRYDLLIPGDFAVMEFGGHKLPNTVRVVLVALQNPNDTKLHDSLSAYLPGDDASMEVLSEENLHKAVIEASPDVAHPIRYWLNLGVAEEIEESLFGDEIEEDEKIANDPRFGRKMSPADFNAKREAAAKTGQLGEELLKAYFDRGVSQEVKSYDWVSQVNAISPYDFKITTTNGDFRYADAKSTSGPFTALLYLSRAEIKFAVESKIEYDIYRLYEIDTDKVKCRVARNIGRRLRLIADKLDEFPQGVKVDALSFKPEFFEFNEVAFVIDNLYSVHSSYCREVILANN